MDSETSLIDIAALKNDLKPVCKTTLTQLVELCELVIANPLFLIGVGLVLAGFVVGIFNCITRRDG